MRRSHSASLLATTLLLSSIWNSAADILDQTFIWGINTDLIKLTSNGLGACSSVPIYVGSRNPTDPFQGVPPFTMYAFKVGGIPTTQVIGSDPTNLTWVVDHSPGSTVMLTVLDGNNKTGGVDTTFYFVTDGPSTCQPTPSNPSTLPTISANVTDQLQTCQPWGLSITNGTGPFDVWLPGLNIVGLPVINMDEGNDMLVYPDQTVPNTKLMASVYDVGAGAWGISTGSVDTTGSDSTVCPGASIVQSKSQPSQSATPNDDPPSHVNIGLIVGIVVGVTVLMCFILALSFWHWHRRRESNDTQRGVWDTRDVLAHAWDPPSPPSAERHPTMYEGSSLPSSVPLLTRSIYTAGTSDVFSPMSLISGSTSGPSSSNLGITTVASSTSSRARALESQGIRQNWHSPGSFASSSQGSLTLSQLPPGAAAPLTSMKHYKAVESDTGPSVIIQHLDGGSGGVQELPPPYIGQPNVSAMVDS
ncbi:hypothetical protein QCA50_018006 [Cerrena zonata]|uniref:Uncharacterized protein n=1 Tax=Cerrena zonata TaxID=2478898 RepID=A0AAW0FP46_9APHY